jgi:hypothetical protein
MFSWNVEHYDRSRGPVVPVLGADSDSMSLVEDFALAVRGEKQPICTFHDAVGSVVITSAATRSCLTGGEPVRLDDHAGASAGCRS